MFDEERLNKPLHKNSHLTTKELAEKIKRPAVDKHHSIENVQKCGALVPVCFKRQQK